MNFDQAAIFCLLLGMILVYALERFRIEVVALTGLGLGFALGLVPAEGLFAGFASPAVVTVVEILLIVGVLSRTHVVEGMARAIVTRVAGERAVLAVLCAIGALVSVSINNIGALALMFPVTLSVCARLRIAPAHMLMPLSFATLLGGLCSLTGTPANLIVNDWLVARTGTSFGYFELGIVGLPLTLAGLGWLVAVAPRTFPSAPEGAGDVGHAGPSEYLCERNIPPGSRLAGLVLPDAERLAGVRIHDVVRDGAHVFARRETLALQAGDFLIASGEITAIDALADRGDLRWSAPTHADGRLDVVVLPESMVLGSRIGWIHAFAEQGVRVAAIASRHARIEGRFADLQIGLGDVLLLSGPADRLREAARDAGVLPLSLPISPRPHPHGRRALLAFCAGVAATATGIVPPQVAFGIVVLAMAMLGPLQLRAGLQDLNWSIVILLACMIPLGAAVESTGAARVIANGLVDHLPLHAPLAAVAVMLLLAVAITPFVDNVSTAVVLSPIAASLSARTGVAVEPLLVAVATGASLDFLTPFGHHNNSVVMGAGGYRFVDFPRLGAPLLLIAVPLALAVIWLAWL